MKFGQWIKLMDTLPPVPKEDKERYLVTIKGEEVREVYYVRKIREGKEVCFWEWMNKNCPWEVIAWMPFPEPFQDEKVR